MYYMIEGGNQKGANSVCSYLYNAFQTIEFSPFKKVIIFSDSCFGQNKNYLMMKFLGLMAIEFNIELMQMFPVVGHSYSTCDRNFANFTKKLKRIQTIEHPDEYVKILKDLKFKVLKSKIYNWKSIFQKNITNNKVEIAKCVQILYKTDGSVVTFH